MGHALLGTLPKTKKWVAVVGYIANGAGVAQIAQATIRAAARGLGKAANDPGVIESVWLTMQLPLAARQPDFGQALQLCGLHVSASPAFFEIVGAVTEVIDTRMHDARRTDLGEMAQMACSETLQHAVGGRLPSLFGSNSDDVKQTFAGFATVKEYGRLAHQFFSRFIYRCLNYCLSKTLSLEVGEGKRFSSLAQCSTFTKALETHCQQTSRIVEKYAGEWFSKTKWEQGGTICREAVQRFTGYAMKKLVSELETGVPHAG